MTGASSITGISSWVVSSRVTVVSSTPISGLLLTTVELSIVKVKIRIIISIIPKNDESSKIPDLTELILFLKFVVSVSLRLSASVATTF